MPASTIDTGSSAITSLGRIRWMRAIITRWRMPPLSWCGYLPKTSFGRRSTARNDSAMRSRASSRRMGSLSLRMASVKTRSTL